jgi:hypothetical protein
MGLRGLSKWQVITLRAIFMDAGLMEAHVLAQISPFKIVYIKFKYSSAGGIDPKTLKVGYHYRYDGRKFEPLPIGKNS